MRALRRIGAGELVRVLIRLERRTPGAGWLATDWHVPMATVVGSLREREGRTRWHCWVED